MRRFLIVSLVCLFAVAMAEEFPYVPGMKVNLGTGDVRPDQETKVMDSYTDPVWKHLEKMTLVDRKNSQINIELEPQASQAALDLARQIENLWNGGSFEEALSRFPELGNLTDVGQMAIGNAWRVPIPTYTQSKWGHDVRVGNRDSVMGTHLDIHRASGNLLSVLLLDEPGNNWRWTMNLSTNGGATWIETYDWWASFEIDIGATVLANHIYVGYAHQTYGRIRRCRANNGASENFNNGQAFINVYTTTPPDSVNEIAITGNQDFFNNRLYYVSLTTQGNLAYYWSDSGAISWTEVTTGVTNGHRGLDAACNEGYADYFLLASYISQRDSVYIDGRSSTAWTHFIRYPIGSHSVYDYTAIGGWRDTIFGVFGFRGPVTYHCRYLTNYTAGGGTWFFGNIGGDTTTTSESPDATLRDGGGCGVVYRYYTATRQMRYTWRRYAGSWSTPVSVADYEPYYTKPAIEYLGSSVFGTVYHTWNTPYRWAYFDRSDWIGIDEENTARLTQLGHLAPNPARLLTNLTYALKNAGNVKIALYDATGRVVKTLVNEQMNAGEHNVRISAQDLTAGVYFVRMDTPDGISSTPMTIVK